MENLSKQQNIPKGWEVKKLDDFVESNLITLGRGNVISKNDIKASPGDFPIYSSSVKNNGLFGKYGDYMFDEEMITWSVDGGGDFFYRPKHKFSVTNVCGFMRVDQGQFDYGFLAYYLQKEHSRKSFNYQSKAHPSVIRQQYDIAKPPLKEQQKIAEVLGAVDEEIEKTKEVIKTTEKLKKGLMQKLFTQGIGHTKFKQTELGEIPESWEIGGFEKLVDPENKNAIKPGPFGSALKKEFYVPEGYKIYGQEQVLNNDPYYGDYYINEEKYRSLEAFKVIPKDLLISLVGTIGKTLIVPADAEPGIINPRLLKVTLDHDKADARFVDYLLHSPILINQMTSRSHGGTMSILNKGMLLSVNFPIPPKKEQEEITKILLAVDEKIAVNRKLLAKQIELKKGLMQDLLSGAKRVKV